MPNTPNQTAKPRVFTRVVVPIVVTLVVSALTIMYGNRVIDHVVAASFRPDAEITNIHDELNLTPEGSDLLYASKPEVQSAASFNTSCKSTERTAAILGCYVGRHIYLFKITNTELAGAEESTAAHEMLHAAYDRLNFFDRSYVNSLIDTEYQKVKDNPEITKLMKYYQQAEPDDLTNELHSILGTTLITLSPDLEHYYSRYFHDRQAVVKMNQQYTGVFNELQAQAQVISAKIDAMKPQVNSELESYNAELEQLNNDISAFNAKAKSNYYKTQAAFTADRQALVARLAALNARRETINADVATYNDLIAQLNKLSVKVNELNSSINAAPAPTTGL